MFAKLKSLLGDKAKKFSGRTDFLEAVCAASALVASADGDLDDKELLAAVKAVKSNAALAAAFDERTIETTMDRMCSRAVGRVGKSGLYREIEDIKSDHDMAETVLLVALDVADSGGISPEERAVLAKVASSLNLDLAKYE